MKCAKFSTTASLIAIKLCMNIYASHWMNWTLVWKDMCTKWTIKDTTVVLSITYIYIYCINYDHEYYLEKLIMIQSFLTCPIEDSESIQRNAFFQYIMTWPLESHLTFCLCKFDYENTKSTFGHGWCSGWSTNDTSLLHSLYAFAIKAILKTWKTWLQEVLLDHVNVDNPSKCILYPSAHIPCRVPGGAGEYNNCFLGKK